MSRQVLLRIARGECPAGDDLVYEASVSRSEPAAMHAPGPLPPGAYAWAAVAYDDRGYVVAEGCSSLELPAVSSVEVLLLGTGQTRCQQDMPDGSPDDAGAPLVDSGPVDSGPVDSGADGGPTQETWTVRSDMPRALGCLASAVLSDGVHVLGGSLDFGGAMLVQDHNLYDASTDSWSTAPADVPDTNVWCAQANVHNDKLYLTGGWPSGDTLFRVYDPVANTWQSLPSLPDYFSYGYASAVAGDFLYLIGGRDQASSLGRGYKYSFASGTWSPIAPIPRNEGTGSLAAAVWEGRIYVINGDAPGGDTVLQIYDIAANAWSSGPNLASHHEGAAAAALGGRVYFFGGVEAVYTGQGAVHQTVNIYDIANRSWSTGTPMGTGRFRLSAVGAGDAIYVLGGFLADGTGTATLQVYRP